MHFYLFPLEIIYIILDFLEPKYQSRFSLCSLYSNSVVHFSKCLFSRLQQFKQSKGINNIFRYAVFEDKVDKEVIVWCINNKTLFSNFNHCLSILARRGIDLYEKSIGNVKIDCNIVRALVAGDQLELFKRMFSGSCIKCYNGYNEKYVLFDGTKPRTKGVVSNVSMLRYMIYSISYGSPNIYNFILDFMKKNRICACIEPDIDVLVLSCSFSSKRWSEIDTTKLFCKLHGRDDEFVDHIKTIIELSKGF